MNEQWKVAERRKSTCNKSCMGSLEDRGFGGDSSNCIDLPCTSGINGDCTSCFSDYRRIGDPYSSRLIKSHNTCEFYRCCGSFFLGMFASPAHDFIQPLLLANLFAAFSRLVVAGTF